MGYVRNASNFDFGSGIQTKSSLDTKGDSWDFPLLVKYRFKRHLRPYVAGGGVLRYVAPIHGLGVSTITNLVTGATVSTPIDTSDPADLRKRVYPGLTAGGGIEFGVRRMRLLPEARYTRWTANIAGSLGGPLRFEPNQVQFLFGLLF